MTQVPPPRIGVADPPDDAPAARGDRSWWSRGYGWARNLLVEEPLLVAILAAAFLIRLLLAGWNSYWLDELYSVAIYGAWNDSLVDMVRNLAQTSVHPPLYQSILYLWIDRLGSGEVVTRTLSNLYVTGAGLVLFLALRQAFGRRIALVSTAAFSIMGATMYYGMETRSYAQTILLATVSSYFVVRLVTSTRPLTPRVLLASVPGAGLVAANTALVFTHYYNGFLVAAQALFVAGYLVTTQPVRQWVRSTAAAVLAYAVPAALFWLGWGSRFVATYRSRSDGFAIEDVSELVTPFDLFVGNILTGNLTFSGRLGVLWVLILAAFAGAALVAVVRARRRVAEVRDRWVELYLVAWLFLPLVVGTVVFGVVGVARFHPRYFIFSVVPLAPLVVLVVDRARRTATALAERKALKIAAGPVLAAIAAVVLVVAFLPGTRQTAALRKTDWRGTAQTISSIVASNPEASFVVLEPSFRATPLLDFYLARHDGDLRIEHTIRRHDENRGGPFAFETDPTILAGHDYLIVPFVHQTTSYFPIALERLEEYADIHLAQIDGAGRGLIVYAIHDTD